jgi:hypothetical protein
LLVRCRAVAGTATTVSAVQRGGGPYLAANQPRRFYRGGAGIARFRGVSQEFPNSPEDFIASTVETNAGGGGLSELSDGRVLRDLIAADPEGFLGPDRRLTCGSRDCGSPTAASAPGQG